MDRMYRYRVYGENTNYGEIVALAQEHFPSFTVYRPEGVYNGVREHAVVIEVLDASASIIQQVNNFAWKLRKVTDQETVLVTHEEIEGKVMS